jgi:hypothetical protein
MFFLNDADKMVPRVFGFLLLRVYLYEAHTTKKLTKQEELAPPKKKKREERERSASRQKKTPLVYHSLKRAHAT